MSFTATGVRKRNLDTDRLQNLINADEQGFIQRMKPFNSESPSRGLQIGQGGGQQPNLAADIFTTFGKGINGAIGYVQGAVEVAVGDTIDFFHDATEDIFSSYLKIVNAGVGKVVDIFNGGDFPGQILKLQGDDTDTVTINNANDPGNTTGNVILPGVGASMTLAVEQLTEFVFDPLKNINGHTGAWRLASEATAGGGTLPSGTAVNDHLEWNGVSWDAAQNFEFNATGPFADSGFLRFPNDNIMLSARNQLDDGNLELKIDSSDRFDFTESNEAPVILQWRAQHATAPDQQGTIEQQSNVTGEMVLRTPDGFAINIGGAPTATFAALASTGIEFFDFLDMSGNQVQDLTALVYTGFSTDGKSISRFLTGSGGINYDLENAGAEHVFRVNGATPTEVLAVRDLGLLVAPAKILTFDVTSGSQGSINKTQASTMDFLCNDSFEFDTGNDATPIILYESGNDTDGLLAMNLSFNAESDVASTPREYANIKITIEDSANTLEDGSVRIAAMSNGVPDVGFYKANGLTVENEMFKPLRMATGDSLFVDTNFIDMNDLATPANPSAGTRRLFVDSGTNELSVRTNAGATVSLEAAAAGSQTPWLTDIVAAGFDLNDLSNLEFRVTVSKPAASISAVYNEAGGMRYNSGVSENHEWSINDSIELTLNGSSLDLVGNNILNAAIMQSADAQVADNGTVRLGNAQSIQWRNSANDGNATFNYDSFDDFVFNFNALTGTANYLINAIDDVVVRLRSENASVGEGAGFFIFEGDNASAVTQEYARITAIIRDPTAALEDGSFSFNVHQAGANITYLSLRGDNAEIDMFRALVMNTNPVIQVDFLALTEKASDPPVIANEGVFYTKDVGGNTRPFFDNNTEAPIELGAAGSLTPWTEDIDADGNSLQDLDTLEFRDNVTAPATNIGAIYYENTTTGLNYNVITGDDHTWRVNGAIQMKLDTLSLSLGDMAGGGEIECNIYESSSDGVVEISMDTTGMSFGVNTGDTFQWTIVGGATISMSGVNWDMNNNNIIDTGDIRVDSSQVRAFSGTNIAIKVTNNSSAIGTAGTMQIPVITTVDPNESTLNTQFGAVNGAIGLANANATFSKFQVRSNGNWQHVFLSNSN